MPTHLSTHRGCLENWGASHAYVSCGGLKPSQLLSCILSQLWEQYDGRKRKRSEGYAAVAGCDSYNEFAQEIASESSPLEKMGKQPAWYDIPASARELYLGPPQQQLPKNSCLIAPLPEHTGHICLSQLVLSFPITIIPLQP